MCSDPAYSGSLKNASEAITIRIDEKARIIKLAIFRPQSRRSVVLAPVRDAGCMEGIHCGGVGSDEAEMQSGAPVSRYRGFDLRDPQADPV